MTDGLSKQYRPKDHESRVWNRWTAEKSFAADPERVLSGDAQPYCVLIPPPNVTAALHLGHALNNTLQDVLVRAHRMMGYETLWLPGTDHAGIATQTVVDKRLTAEGKPNLADHKKQELADGTGREAFIAEVQAFKDEYEARITEQLKAMGCSCDFDRQRFTMDAICARAVREAFFRLFKDGLIYRGKRLVNWDPVSQTALADDEVEMREVEGIFAYMRYPLVHPSDAGDHRPITWSELGARGYPDTQQYPGDDQAWVTVATTRPETYLGDTGVAINPTDPRAGALRGLMVELPLVGRRIPIVEDDYVVLPVALGGDENDAKARMATGFLKVTPAHDPNDEQIGTRHNLAVINVMARDATISPDFGWDDYDPRSGAHVFVGLSREDARQKVLDEFKARNAGNTDFPLLETVKPHTHSVGHSYRSHVPIEPYLSDQWYVRVKDDRLRGKAQRAINPEQRSAGSLEAWPESGAQLDTVRPHGDGGLTFHPPRYAKTYETWHDNLRDWCISRQLWWGHRIPVWHRRMTINRGDFAEAGEVGAYGLDHLLRGEYPHGVIRIQDEAGTEHEAGELLRVDDERDRTFDIFVCYDGADPSDQSRLEEAGFTQDSDVLDTWFSSALWPLSTMGWPEAHTAASDTGIADFPSLLPAFNPTSVLLTAREIITLWVSRMVMFNRYFLGEGNGQSAIGNGESAKSLGSEGSGHVPFHDVFIHAMIQDGEGRKMSKSLGNGVDPLDIIHSHGTDAMRYTLVQMTTQTQDVRMPVVHDPATGKNTSPKFDAGRNFANKLWNAARFTLSILDKTGDKAGDESLPDVAPAELSLVDRWMLARLHDGIAACEQALATYQFASYAEALYDLARRDFCDWYLEAIKATVNDSPAQRTVLRQTLDAILRLLHPAMPYVTEVINEELGRRSAGAVAGLTLGSPSGGHTTLCRSGWPVADPSLADADALASFERLRSLVDIVREVRSQHTVPPKRTVTLHVDSDLASAIARSPGVLDMPEVKCVVTTEPPEGEAVSFRFESTEPALSDLADAVDADAERARLTKLVDDLGKSIKSLNGRLNPSYVERAPAHLVEQTRQQLREAEDQAKAARDALDALG